MSRKIKSEVVGRNIKKKQSDELSSMSEDEYDMLVQNDLITLDLRTVEAMRDQQAVRRQAKVVDYFKSRNAASSENQYSFDQIQYQRKAMANFNKSQYQVSDNTLPNFQRSFGEPKSSEDDYVANVARFSGFELHKKHTLDRHPRWNRNI